MGVFDNFKNIFSKNTQPILTKQSPMVMMQNVGYGYRKKEKYDDYVKEGYQENAIVYRCVNEIASGASAISFKVFDGDTELDAHPVIDLLQRPSPLMAGVEFFHCLYTHLLISGNAYIVVAMIDNQISEMHILRPDRIKIVPSKTMIPSAYEYMIGGKVVNRYDIEPETGKSDVKHFKFMSPSDDYYGLSPMSPASVNIDQHNASAKHNYNLLNNGARPSGAIVFKPKDESGMSIQLSESQRQQLLSDLDLRFSGTHNSGKAMLLEGDFDWKEMGLTPKDMDFLELKNMASRDIALCFGVPSQLVGVPDNQTYNNVAEARLALYEDTIIPLASRIESDLNEYIKPYFQEDISIKYDFDSIPAMAERRRRIYENVTQAVREGIISRNEARERLGYEPVEGGDDVYISANLFPLGSPSVSPAEQPSDEDAKMVYGDEPWQKSNKINDLETKDPRYGQGKDVFETVAEARERAKQIGCEGTHTIKGPDGNFYMPCSSHAIYLNRTKEEDYDNGEDKAESDVDTQPTEEMAREAKRGLDWRKEYKRGGTEVGVARAVQLTNKENLSPSVVRRMHSFFSRHEVDKEAQGFRKGEEGYPSAGRIAWALWGGDAGQSWAKRKTAELDKERDEAKEILEAQEGTETAEVIELKELSSRIRKTLENKVKEHNDKHGDKKGKRVTLRMLSAVFRRGVGAYRTNPESVRRNVTGSDQWAIARVNAFLFAVRTGRYRSGKFDRDLLPSGHPLKSDKEKSQVISYMEA